MTTDLQPFTFPATGGLVRTVNLDGAPWFVLSDLAKLLEYRDAEKAKRLLRDSQLNTLPKGIASELGFSGGRLPYVVNESGLYRLMMRSDSERAEDFQVWIEDVVLPTIRRTGSYTAAPAVPRTYAEALRAAADAVEAQERAELDAAQAREQVAELEPLAAKYRTVLDADGLTGMTAIADMLDVHVNTLTDWLVEKGVFRKAVSEGQSGPKARNLPRRSWQKTGHFTVRKEHRGRASFPVAYATATGLDHILTLWSAR